MTRADAYREAARRLELEADRWCPPGELSCWFNKYSRRFAARAAFCRRRAEELEAQACSE